MTTIADIFDLPERVHQGDFVLRLAEGVERPEQTLGDYVVTEQLARCFDAALSLIGSAVTANTSKGAYLHGSFGSGKSHFMAVLTLLLRRDPGARSITELAGAVAKANEWTKGRRFLVVPYHMIGATSMESAILGTLCRARPRDAPRGADARVLSGGPLVRGCTESARQDG